MTGLRVAITALAATLGAALAGSASAAGSPEVAALQVALRERALYAGAVDGVAGPLTAAALARFQLDAELRVSGSLDPPTRRALGSSSLGARLLTRGVAGWDVAALQFSLAWHGFPCGPFDGIFGERTRGALRRFQRWAGLVDDGVAGADVVAALARPRPAPSIVLAPPVPLVPSSGFGPRGDRFHAGLDLDVPAGTTVHAAHAGRVAYAGWRDGGAGNVVTVADGSGVRTLYAHLDSVSVALGQRVEAGDVVGLVGATGSTTGPHLHFEVRLRGAAVDPAPLLPPASSRGPEDNLDDRRVTG
jgi:murein DD-endopeptidase MepM/ murein hydrolase activator NlpD